MTKKELKKNNNFASFIKSRKRNKKISLGKIGLVAEYLLRKVEENPSVEDENKLNLLLQYHNIPIRIKISDIDLLGFLGYLIGNKKKIDKSLSFLIDNAVDANLKYLLVLFLRNDPFVCVLGKLIHNNSFKIEFSYKNYDFSVVRLNEYV
jgi:hypothetical protein